MTLDFFCVRAGEPNFFGAACLGAAIKFPSRKVSSPQACGDSMGIPFQNMYCWQSNHQELVGWPTPRLYEKNSGYNTNNLVIINMVICWDYRYNLYNWYNITGWWLTYPGTYPSEKYEFVSWDDSSQHMEKWKMLQTTNQLGLLYFGWLRNPAPPNGWLKWRMGLLQDVATIHCITDCMVAAAKIISKSSSIKEATKNDCCC